MSILKLPREKLQEVIVPIFIATKGDDPDLIEYLGTGFILAPKLIVTCWHVVNVNITSDQQIVAIVVKEDGSDHKLIPLVNLERDGNNLDLATANHLYEPSDNILVLSKIDSPFGLEVWTYGYPLSEPKLQLDGTKNYIVPPQYFKGYIMRDLYYEHAEYGSVPSYEIDINVPQGLSGAPLMEIGTTLHM